MLLLSPLPTVETACAVLEQEEAQRLLLGGTRSSNDAMAMYSRNQPDRQLVCGACGVKGHVSERCWTVVGFPKWHPRSNRPSTNRPRVQHNAATSNNKWNP